MISSVREEKPHESITDKNIQESLFLTVISTSMNYI